MAEHRWLTFSYDDPDDASCLDVATSLAAARRDAPIGATYRYRVQGDQLLDETFVEVRGGIRQRHSGSLRRGRRRA